MAVCRGYCMTSSTGSTSLTEYNLSSPCWCIDVFMEQLRCTWWTAAHQRPKLLVVTRQHLRSASQRKLIVPRYRLNSYGRRCFAVAGPSTWNSLPDSLRDPALSLNIFRRQLKTHFFAKYWRDVLSALEIFFENALYKFTLYLLTYLLTYSGFCGSRSRSAVCFEAPRYNTTSLI